MSKVSVNRSVTFTLTLSENETVALRDLLGGGVSSRTLNDLGLGELERQLTDELDDNKTGKHLFKQLAERR